MGVARVFAFPCARGSSALGDVPPVLTIARCIPASRLLLCLYVTRIGIIWTQELANLGAFAPGIYGHRDAKADVNNNATLESLS